MTLTTFETADDTWSIDPFRLTAINPLTPMSDQDRISPYNINQISDENKEKYQFGDN